MMDKKCFADKGFKRCGALDCKQCEGKGYSICNFYKTHKQFSSEAKAAKELHKKHIIKRRIK